MATLLWLQGGAYSGNTVSFLNAEEPSACDLVTDFGIDVLWHPSLGMERGDHVKAMLADPVSGRRPLDILVFEGTVIRAPDGTGRRKDVALDTAWRTHVPKNATLIRNIAQACDTLLSIPRWFYALFAVDFTNKNDAHLPEYDEVCRRFTPIDPADGPKQGKYSWAKSPRYEVPGRGSMPLEVSPLARPVIAGRPGATGHQDHDPLFLDAIRTVGPSILVRVMDRMHEACKYRALARKWLAEIDLHAPFCSQAVEHASGRGFGSTEAARGSLSDWIAIDQGRIANDQVVTPTAWNIGPQDAKQVHGPMEQSFIGAPIKDPGDPVEMRHMAPSYDSCLVCTVHPHDGKTGRELAKFQIGETG